MNAPLLRILAVVACLVAAPARAQTTAVGEPLRTVQDVLAFLVTNQGVQTADFDKDREAAEATRQTLTRALLASVATLPVSTSSSGFTYRLNPVLGTVERATQTFGPFFIDRALTSGAGQASIGVTFQHASFGDLDGNDLRDGSFLTVANQFTDEPAPFDVETLTLRISTTTTTLFGNVGLSDRIDVGVAMPLVHLRIDGARVNNYRGQDLLQARAEATRFGLADVALRSKVRLTGEGAFAAAAGLEARLPIGREENLLGAGETAFRASGLFSYDSGRASLHGNATLGGGGLGREFGYGGAVGVAATQRVTIVGEVLARRQPGVQRISEVVAPHPRIAGVQTTRLVPAGADQTTVVAVAGFKWNVGGAWLLHGHVLMPLVDRGLTARVTPMVALDYSFAR